MKIGYMRVSTDDQDTLLQESALVKHGCDNIFTDKISGRAISRQGLDECLDSLRSGDTLVVWKLDRLGRTVRQLKDVIEDLQSKGISFASLTEMIDTSTPPGRLFFHMLAAFAEFERDVIKQRTQAGMDAAKASGVHCGRPKGPPPAEMVDVVQLSADGKSIREIAKILSINRGKVERILKAYW